MKFRLPRKESAESIDPGRERRNITLFLVLVGALGAASVLVPMVESAINIALVLIVAIPIGVTVVGWLVVQLVAELELLRHYDSPAQRVEALRRGHAAWLVRKAQAERESEAAARVADGAEDEATTEAAGEAEGR